MHVDSGARCAAPHGIVLNPEDDERSCIVCLNCGENVRPYKMGEECPKGTEMDLIEETNELLYPSNPPWPNPFRHLLEERTCQHCAHWNAPTHRVGVSRDSEGKVELAGWCKQAHDWSEKPGPCIGEDGDPSEFGSHDVESYGSSLRTGPRFGCVHWRAGE